MLAASSDVPVTYSGQIADIFNRRCVVCHREGEVAPFVLTDYRTARRHAAMIREVVQQRRMPPWNANPEFGHFANANELTEAERQAIDKWVESGAPVGDHDFVPDLPSFPTGWKTSGNPDLVVDVSEKPFEVPANEVLDYQFFTVDLGFKEDRWVKETQVIPGNRRVVHHVGVALKPPRGWRGDRSHISAVVAGYVPGAGFTRCPESSGFFIPAGSKLLVTMHYTPIGVEQLDQTKIGFVFADEKTIDHSIVYRWIVDRALDIPPHEDRYVSRGTWIWPSSNARLLSMQTHMHLRGKSISVFADFPNGTSECLLDVPTYRFDWQWVYELQTARKFPKGTVMRSVAIFDNSADNPANPDPNARVRWGRQTSDEMLMVCFGLMQPR